MRQFETRVACVGVGGQGWINARAFGRHSRITVLCDPDSVALARATAVFPDAAQCKNLEGLARLHDTFDALVVSTPDHSHYRYIELAVSLGKHCYCEKPLVNSLRQCADLRKLNLESIRTFLGCQAITTPSFRAVASYLRSNCPGHVQVHAWTDRPFAGQQPKTYRRNVSAKKETEIDWQEWLADSSPVPFSTDIHPMAWRESEQFGSGAIGDMGSHLLALPFKAFSVQGVREVHSITNSRGRAGSEALRFRLDAGNCNKLEVFWYAGHQPVLPMDNVRIADNGVFIKQNGQPFLYSPEWDYAHPFIIGDPGWRLLTDVSAEYRRSLGGFEGLTPYEHWLDCIESGHRTMGDFVDFGLPLTEILLAGKESPP